MYGIHISVKIQNICFSRSISLLPQDGLSKHCVQCLLFISEQDLKFKKTSFSLKLTKKSSFIMNFHNI